MKLLLKLSAVLAAGTLAACQHTQPVQQPPQAADPGPPSATQGQQAGATQQAVQQPRMCTAAQQAPARPAGGAGAQNQAAAQQQVIITLHLAQQKQEENLVPVNAGGNAPLYALPQPVLTQADMKSVTPVRGPDQANYLLFEMNPESVQKLRLITERAKGHYLLLSVGGQLASVVQIGDPINDGRLLVGTQGPEHTQAILRLMRGN